MSALDLISHDIPNLTDIPDAFALVRPRNTDDVFDTKTQDWVIVRVTFPNTTEAIVCSQTGGWGVSLRNVEWFYTVSEALFFVKRLAALDGEYQTVFIYDGGDTLDLTVRP